MSPKKKLEPVADEETRCAWALWPAKGGGWQWCRVLLPVSVLEAHRAGPIGPPEIKNITVAKIENDLVSERVVDRRDWGGKPIARMMQDIVRDEAARRDTAQVDLHPSQFAELLAEVALPGFGAKTVRLGSERGPISVRAHDEATRL